MSRNRKLYIAIIVVLLLATLAFIWSHSLESIPESRERSRLVTETLRPPLEAVIGADQVTITLVRKLAHVAEFGLLGIELALLALLLGRRGWRGFGLCLLAGLLAAAADETIQLFAHRGAQVQDVALDFAALAAGTALVWLIDYLITRRTQRMTPLPPE